MWSRSSQNLEFGHFTLLFAEYVEEMYQNLKRTCRAFVFLILLFSDVLFAVVEEVAS